MKWIIYFLTSIFMLSFNFSKAENISLKKYESLLSEQEKKQKKAIQYLFEIGRKIKKNATVKYKTQQEILQLEEQLKLSMVQIEELKFKTLEMKKKLNKKLRTIYQITDNSFFSVILNSGSISELDRSIRVVQTLSQKDLSEIKHYIELKKEISAKKIKIENRLLKLKELREKISFQEIQLAKDYKQKQLVIDKIRKDKTIAFDEIEKLKLKFKNEISNGIDLDDSGLIDELYAESFINKKGQLDWPTNGKQLKKFGYIKSDKSSFRIPNKGVFIASLKSSVVESVASGHVSFVGFIPSFGQTIIIDHGQHFYSVYSNLTDLQVKQGDTIKNRRILAHTAFSKSDNVDGVYFEIRHFSEPNDPEQWMKGLLK